MHTWGTPRTPFLVQIHKSCLFRDFDGFSRPRLRVHVLSDSRMVFHVLVARLRSNYVHIALMLRKNCVQSHPFKSLKSRPGQQFLFNLPIAYFF